MTDRCGRFVRPANGSVAPGLRFDDVIRTWLYLGNITGPEGETHRYYELNRARTEFYRDQKFGAGLVRPQSNGRVFPASTGVGMGARTWRSVASRCGPTGPTSPWFRWRIPANVVVRLRPLVRPGESQVRPSDGRCRRRVRDHVHFRHGEHHGLGDPPSRRASSGRRSKRWTTSRRLIAPENFQTPWPARLGSDPRQSRLARVYLQAAGRLRRRQAICRARLGELPVVYVVADICRPELLVEIEGIAFCGRSGLVASG